MSAALKERRQGVASTDSTSVARACFPEAALQTLSQGDIPGRNHHDVYLATYLSSHMNDWNVGYVHVPPVSRGAGAVGDASGYYSAVRIPGPDGT